MNAHTIPTGAALAQRCLDVATTFHTLYVLGAFGWPMTEANKTRAQNAYAYNRRSDRQAKIQAASAETFGFDCVCLIKALLWGWRGDPAAAYGGASYASGGVPDIDEASMIRRCSAVSQDFSEIAVGEVVWMPGHIGVYTGDGLAVECTPIWGDGVQQSAVGNIGDKPGYPTRTWVSHGKLPWLSYDAAEPPAPAAPAEPSPEICAGALVSLAADARYTGGAPIPAWVRALRWYVRDVRGTRAVIDRSEDGGHAICSPVPTQYLHVCQAPPASETPQKPGKPVEPEAPAITVGSAVRLKPGAADYTGKSLAPFVYDRDHVVKSVSGDRAVITYGGTTVAAVHLADLEPVR